MIAGPCNGILDFVLVLRSSGNVIGKLGIWCKEPSNPEIGFMLARAHWSKGFMAEAMSSWLQYLWGADCERLVRGECREAGQPKEFLGSGREVQDTERSGKRLGGIGTYEGGWIERVVADADPRNEACLGVMRRFGFKETGRAERTFKTHLGWCDSVYFELGRP